MDHTGTPESEGRKESMLHMQESGQEVGGAKDGAPAGAQDGAKETVTTHSPPDEQYKEAARLCLLRDAQASIDKGELKGLTTETQTYSVEGLRKGRFSSWEAGRKIT